MNCREIPKSLSSYADGVLSSEEKKVVEEHLKSCAQCSAALSDLLKAKDLLKNLGAVEPPPWLAAKIMTRVREEKEQRASFFKKLFSPFYIKVPIQALTVLLVGVIVFQIYRMVEPEKKTAQAPSSPSVLSEHKALENELPQPVSKSSEALPPELPQKRSPGKVLTKKAEAPQQSSDAAPMELQKSRVRIEENGPPMAEAGPEEKNKKDVTGLAGAPVQTEVSRQLAHGGASEDSGKAALSDKKRAEEEPGASAEATRKPAALPLMPRIIVSTSDTSAAKMSAEDMVKQLGGKQIEIITQGDMENIIAELPSAKVKELSEKLKSLGEIKSEPELSELPAETVRVRIEIIPR